MGLIREVVKGAAAIIALLFGVLVIWAIFNAAAEMAEAWWMWIVGGAIALVIAGVAATLIFLALSKTVGTTSLGWAGMCTGRKPLGFGPADQNLAKALGSLVLFGGCVYLGWGLYRTGVTAGELNWSVMGLMLIGSGTVVGLLNAVPRFYYARRKTGGGGSRLMGRGRKGKPKPLGEEVGDHVASILTLGLCSIALSMCVADTIQHHRARSGEAELAYGDWFDGCIEPDGDLPECTPGTVKLDFRPRRVVRQRVEYLGKCDIRFLHADGTPIEGVKRKGNADTERMKASFDVEPDQRYRIEVVVDPKRDVCVYSVRFFDDPEGDA